jgi:hypothetical protein
MDDEELARKKQHYTRMLSGSYSGGVIAAIFLGPFALASAGTAGYAAYKLAVIHDEMKKPHRQYTHTRGRDVFGGAVIHGATAVGGHYVGHAANHLISHATHHALSRAQDACLEHAVHKGEHAAAHRLEHALIRDSPTRHWICDNCYCTIENIAHHWHCKDCPDFDLCRTCYKEERHCHPSYHSFV